MCRRGLNLGGVSAALLNRWPLFSSLCHRLELTFTQNYNIKPPFYERGRFPHQKIIKFFGIKESKLYLSLCTLW